MTSLHLLLKVTCVRYLHLHYTLIETTQSDNSKSYEKKKNPNNMNLWKLWRHAHEYYVFML